MHLCDDKITRAAQLYGIKFIMYESDEYADNNQIIVAEFTVLIL